MAEPTADDVEAYTKGRLPAADSETIRMLAAALMAARSYCGWNVHLLTDDQVSIDSPGGRVLSLPTLRLVELSAVTENGEVLDVSTLAVSKRLGVVSKADRKLWAAGYGAVEVTMTHGYDDPADFNQAVLVAVDRMAQAALRSDSALQRKKIDDVEYQWFESAGNVLDLDILDGYRIYVSP